MICAHRLPFGAEVEADDPTRFRLWAPSCREVAELLVYATAPEPGDGAPLPPRSVAWCLGASPREPAAR